MTGSGSEYGEGLGFGEGRAGIPPAGGFAANGTAAVQAGSDFAEAAGDRVRDLISRVRDTAHNGAQAAQNQAHAAETQGRAWVGETHDAVLGRQAAGAHDTLDLQERDRLPWLESEQDAEDYAAVDTRRVIGVIVGGLLLLALIVGAIWWLTHRRDDKAPPADGSTLAAPAAPFKVAPSDPGGKKFNGTDDSAYAVSMGKSKPAQLAAGEAVQDAPHAAASSAAQAAASVAAAVNGTTAGAGVAGAGAAVGTPATAKPAADAPADTGGPAGGVVQIAAYSSRKLADAGWNRLIVEHDSLKGVTHRVVEANIDMGTVYRLQLVTGAGGGAALCARLKGEGLPCQVRH